MQTTFLIIGLVTTALQVQSTAIPGKKASFLSICKHRIQTIGSCSLHSGVISGSMYMHWLVSVFWQFFWKKPPNKNQKTKQLLKTLKNTKVVNILLFKKCTNKKLCSHTVHMYITYRYIWLRENKSPPWGSIVYELHVNLLFQWRTPLNPR